ncbi:LysR family transcriptional regulator [Pseudorhodoferax sp.]|uniref:LysR family transcriptional regulator n=1 Tax=Pseudorhodoferax sp. TaxID=1993553 RepID=UPI002DD633DD|nr:LysR family transcriptional regulator [Pseudorhodoferax sp.]
MISDTNGEPGSQPSHARLPSLVALRCFEAAARAENFSRAADELHLTHGAISRAVRTLEDDLGLALFERRSRRVFLTEAGRKLFKAVHEGLGLIQQATRELRGSVRQAPLVVSCEPTLLMRWLIPRWPGFQAQHPGTSVHLVAGGGPVSFDAGIDLAIRRDDFIWPPSVHAEALFAEKTGPVCSPGQVAALFTSRSAQPRLRAGAVQLQTRTRPQAWQEWASASGQPLPTGKAQVFEHFYFSLQAAVAGLGVAIGPWHLVCDDIASGLLVAPMGFTEDGSRYHLLSPRAAGAAGPQAQLLAWLRSVS